MKYFTPELYNQFNSHNAEEVHIAHEAWEMAIENYHSRLNEIHLPDSIKTLSEMNFHDANVLLLDITDTSVKMTLDDEDGKIYNLVYAIVGKVKQSVCENKCGFSIGVEIEDEVDDAVACLPDAFARKDWLYDEMDQQEDGAYVHRILFSDGVSIEIPFSSVEMIRNTSPKS